MFKSHRHIANICLTVFVLYTGTLFAQSRIVVIDPISINSAGLVFGFHIDSLIDRGIIDGLNKGFTVTLEYQIDLWKVRNGWFDSQIARHSIRYKLGFSKLEQRYIIYNELQEERFVTSSLEKAVSKCSGQNEIILTDSVRIIPDSRYYIIVQGILEPFSVENLDEMRKWLGGEIGELDLKNKLEESPKRLTSRFLVFIKNAAGFGNRQYLGKSRDFYITSVGEVKYIDK